MKLQKFLKVMSGAGRRFHVVGGEDFGLVAALDMEGRIFTVLGGEVLNRVNLEAITGLSTKDRYLNPGGDGLWPAPEGTCLGYEYSTGAWRVPPGITGARYIVSEERANSAKIAAEIDLISNSGKGIPTIFSRATSVSKAEKTLRVSVVESIQYIGSRTLHREDCILAPWTLCQFDSAEGCEVAFPETDDSEVWDIYDDSSQKRSRKGGLVHTMTDGGIKYQIGIGRSVDWIEFRNPAKGLTVRRTAATLPMGQEYVDIADAPPDKKPSNRETRFSVYSDPSFFMEIEAAGGCPAEMAPGAVMSFDVETIYSLSL